MELGGLSALFGNQFHNPEAVAECVLLTLRLGHSPGKKLEVVCRRRIRCWCWLASLEVVEL